MQELDSNQFENVFFRLIFEAGTHSGYKSLFGCLKQELKKILKTKQFYKNIKPIHFVVPDLVSVWAEMNLFIKWTCL